MNIDRLFIILLKVAFFFATKLKVELCYDPDDRDVYQVTKRGKTGCTLLPLLGADTVIFDRKVDNLIFSSNIEERSQNIAFGTPENAFETLSERTDIRSENVDTSLTELNSCISETQNNIEQPQNPRDYIGVGKVNLPRFSILYTGETAYLSVQIEDLLDKIFSATNYPKTIAKTIENYNSAKKYAKNNQIYELKQLAERLQGRINKQAAMQSAMNTMAAQQAARKKMIFSAVAVVVIALLYFGITHFYKNMPSVQTETEITVTTTPLSEIDKAIIEWEQATGRKMYPYGRQCLEKNCKGMSKDQIIREIKRNIK